MSRIKIICSESDEIAIKSAFKGECPMFPRRPGPPMLHLLKLFPPWVHRNNTS
jgi:hypothetical protein